jgi:hypothetical protein
VSPRVGGGGAHAQGACRRSLIGGGWGEQSMGCRDFDIFRENKEYLLAYTVYVAFKYKSTKKSALDYSPFCSCANAAFLLKEKSHSRYNLF